MSNTYFQFKQFRIEQGSAAMKVTTDACILGAWTPVPPQVRRVLDIGAGTGLLSLMLAQRSEQVMIDAIELDADAAGQARENVAASGWKDRVNVVEGDVCSYTFDHKYDLIISNPPFFNNSLLSDKEQKNMARHTNTLSYANLLRVIGDNLAESGYAAVLLPYAEYQVWKELLQDGNWNEMELLQVRHTHDAAVKRVVCVFGKRQGITTECTLVIKDADGKYTTAFTDLLAPYYLDL